MPAPILAAIGLALTAKGQMDQQAQAAMNAASQGNTLEQQQNLEMSPVFQNNEVSQGAAKSAQGRTLEDMNKNQIEPLPPEASMPDTAGLLEPQWLSQGQNVPELAPDPNAANKSAYMPVSPESEPPPQEGGGSEMAGLTSMEIAQLGLALGSQAFQRQPGPRPPGLPGSSFSPMKPVFRG